MGVSYDKPAANKAFRERYGFPYPLLSDTDRSMSAAYEAKYVGLKKLLPFPRRVTYLIDPKGRVARTYEVADPASHAETVLCDLRGGGG